MQCFSVHKMSLTPYGHTDGKGKMKSMFSLSAYKE